MSTVTGRHALTPVATVLLPPERLRVDAAGEGLYRTLHRDSLDDAMHDLKAQRAHAVVISVSCCSGSSVAKVAQLVREFPRVPVAALLTQVDPSTPRDVLYLGRSGLQTLIDVRTAAGWRELREALVAERGASVERLALGQLALDLVVCRRTVGASLKRYLALTLVSRLSELSRRTFKCFRAH